MRIFITGATGFIGKHLVERLATTEHEAWCLVRPGSQTAHLTDLGAHLVPGDVCDRASVLAGMRGCDWLVHLANLYSYWEPDKSVFQRVNVDGTRNVMEAALEAGVSKVAHISSIVIFGKPALCPFDGATPPGPVRFSEYARSKYAGDQIVWDLHARRGLSVVVLYPGGVLGPDDPKSTGEYMRNVMARRIPVITFGNSVISYVYVRDVAEGILRALEKGGNIGEKYILAAYPVAMRDHTRAIAAAAGVAPPTREMPDRLMMLASRLVTGLAAVTHKAPSLGMGFDQLESARHGFHADGGRAQRELGLTYAPYSAVIEEAVASLRREAAP